MNRLVYSLFFILFIGSKLLSQTINIVSIGKDRIPLPKPFSEGVVEIIIGATQPRPTEKPPHYDVGFTLDGDKMRASRAKLLNEDNFDPWLGVYRKSIQITDSYTATNSLCEVSNLPTDNIFFFGCFNQMIPFTNPFTKNEIDSVYNWSLKGGKMIIGTEAHGKTSEYNSWILNEKWGYSSKFKKNVTFYPTEAGRNSDLFSGPFGDINELKGGGSSEGSFAHIPVNSVVFATDLEGSPAVYMDCDMLDLVVSDVDIFTNVGKISAGHSIKNESDIFWANSIVFMDRLQPLPILKDSSATLMVNNAAYWNYEWYFNDSLVNNESSKGFRPSEDGEYYAVVTVNGGCKTKSNIVHFIAPHYVVKVNGKVVDEKTMKPLQSTVKVHYSVSGKEFDTLIVTDIDGNYALLIDQPSSIQFSTTHDGYTEFLKTIQIKEIKENAELKLDLLLKPIIFAPIEVIPEPIVTNKPHDLASAPKVAGTTIVLKNIYFTPNKFDLLPSSNEELDQLVLMMMENPKLKIRVNGHTNKNADTEKFNIDLSTNRALAVKNYLVQHGIAEKRIVYKGYGYSKPIYTGDSIELESVNRRVEIEITSN